ncbi:MAG: MATE family efflux transporter [Pseudomonadota bacterium]
MPNEKLDNLKARPESAWRWPIWAQPRQMVDLMALSIPIAVSRLAWMLMGLTDAVVLGQMKPEELPFVLNAWLPIGVLLGFSMGALMGVQVLTAELSGRGEEDASGRIFRRGLVSALGLAVLFIATAWPTMEAFFNWVFVSLAPPRSAGDLAPDVIVREVTSVTRILLLGLPGFLIGTVCSLYLEALRRPLLVTGVAYFMVGLNVVLNLAFVAGWWGMPALGAEGVAWATTLTRTAAILLFAGFVITLTPGLRRSPPAPANEGRRQISVGLGTAVSNVAEWGGFNATYVIALWISAAVNVVYGFATQVMGAAFMIFLGIATATSVRVAEAFGRGDAGAVREAGRLGVAATLVCGLAMGAILWIGRGVISYGLVDPEAVIDGVPIAAALISVFWLVAAATTFDGLQCTASMALRAQGVVWLPTSLHIGSFFALMLPLGYHLGYTLNRGAQGMLEAALGALFFAGLAQILLLELKTARTEQVRAVMAKRFQAP